MNPTTKFNLELIDKICKNNIINKELIDNKLSIFPIYIVNGEYCLSMVALIENDFKNDSKNDRFFVGSQVGNVLTVKIPLNYLSSSFSHPDISYIEIAERIQPHNHKMVPDVRADSVWNGFNLPKGFTGKNVLIGISDWGFDYGHPMFMDTTLSYSRIRAAWDQFKIIGNPPSGMNYGVEYSSPSALAAANSDTAGKYYDYATHGSHVAGIAAGSGAGTKYRGVAFDAEYLFNSLQLDAGAAIDAFHWMKSIADADGKRLVINMSWGLYYIGTMDGNSLLSKAIDFLSAQNVVFVTSAGNNGQSNFHIKKTFSNDSLRSRIGFYPYSAHPNMWGQCITMWGETSNPFSARFEIYNAANVLVGTSDIFNTNLNFGYFDSILVINSDTIFYNFSVDSSNYLNSRPFIQMRIKNQNTTLKIVLHAFAPSGIVHFWNLVELDNGVGNWGLEFYAYGNYGVAGDSEFGIGEPACTESCIAVAAHSSEIVNLQGTLMPGYHAGFSSIGPLYSGQMKPDISAPGSSVISSINSYTTASYTSSSHVVFNGRTYHFASFSGTSMSSPALAGVAALVLEANPSLSTSQVKSILKTTARQDIRTGSIVAPGNSTWGMGKVTATDAVALALNTVAVYDADLEGSITVFPNPTDGVLSVLTDLSSDVQIGYEIFNIQGQMILKGNLDGSNQILLSDLVSGMFFLKIYTGNSSKIIRFIKF